MFNRDIELFIRDYVNDIKAGSAALFAGAGLSIPAGFVSWKELIGDIAYELELDIEKESDLISLAQYHLNEKGNRHKINQKIITEFAEQAEETENHRIIARLPIASLWTTNYDDLIEKTYARYNRVCDVKTTPESLTNNIHKRDVVLYKMHGDYRNPNQAIITREQYETYSRTHLPFINMLMAELTAKTFLFIGFSFEDPNLQYVLSRLYAQYGEGQRNHYCIMRRVQLGDSGSEDQASCDYNSRKQGLMINDLRRYGIQTLLVDDYRQITDVLYAIETQFKKSTVFISGSADNYQPYTREESIQFIHRLARLLIHKQYRIVNGFGWGVGTAVINGALEAIYDSQGKISESQLVLRPFPTCQRRHYPTGTLARIPSEHDFAQRHRNLFVRQQTQRRRRIRAGRRFIERVPDRHGTRLRLHSYRLYRQRICRDLPKNQGGDERNPLLPQPRRHESAGSA